MLVEIMGIVLVIGTTVIAGFYYGNIETFRNNDLIEMKKALAILRSEIEYAKTPLPEALQNITRKTKNPISRVFMSFDELIHVERGGNIGELWERSIKAHEKETYFNNEDIDHLISFGKTLGYLDKGMQLNNIHILIEYIDDRINALNQSRFKNKKMFQSLGILGGILTVIIFI